jgi:hypothetical protein
VPAAAGSNAAASDPALTPPDAGLNNAFDIHARRIGQVDSAGASTLSGAEVSGWLGNVS